MHQENVRPSGNVWMNGHGKYKLILVLIEVVKMILIVKVSPLFNIRANK